jgi:hypothetical protein
MKIHTIRTKHRLAGLAVALAASMGLAYAAAPAPATTITRVFIVMVPLAQDHAFNMGVKAWWKCMRAHGSKQTSYAYDAETGDLTRYIFLNVYSSWGAMDAHSAAGKACMNTFVTAVQPHASGAFSEVAELNAKDSYMPAADPEPAPMLWVDAYRIKPGHEQAFKDCVAQFAAAAAKIHWQGHFEAYDIDGSGQGRENFVLIWPNKNWADIGQDPSPSAKDMMTSVYGAAGAEASHQKYLAAIAETWEDAWSYDKDLSLIPGK